MILCLYLVRPFFPWCVCACGYVIAHPLSRRDSSLRRLCAVTWEGLGAVIGRLEGALGKPGIPPHPEAVDLRARLGRFFRRLDAAQGPSGAGLGLGDPPSMQMWGGGFPSTARQISTT